LNGVETPGVVVVVVVVVGLIDGSQEDDVGCGVQMFSKENF
jgi:hypothetical protein